MSISDNNTPTYYEVLQVQSYANPAIVVAAYRILSKLYHPDTAKEDANSEKFMLLQQAYETLSDPQKRFNYDQELRARQPGKIDGNYDGGDFGYNPQAARAANNIDPNWGEYKPPTEEELETYRKIYDYESKSRRRRGVASIAVYTILMTAGVGFALYGFILVFTGTVEQQGEVFIYFTIATLLLILAQIEAYVF